MKTKLLHKAALALCAALLPLCAAAQTLRGDVNKDGKVDVSDVTLLINLVLSGDGTAIDMAAADMNGSGIVDVSDVTLLIDIILNGDEATTRTFTVNGVSFSMVKVQAGTFIMGATEEQGDDAEQNEKPAHQVTLTKTYWISQTEVTQELWQAVMGYSNCAYIDPQNPVNMIGYLEAESFCSMLRELTGMPFRLPTEAEWEFAARGGNLSRGYKYAGSDDIDEVAWYRDNSDITLHHVGTKAPNELGIYDMSGNAYEWVKDWLNLTLHPYPSEPQVDPCVSTENAGYRIIRGGTFQGFDYKCRVSSRMGSYYGHGNAEISIRLVY